MPIDRPRRIFRRSARVSSPSGLGRTVAIGLAGGLGGAALVMVGMTTDLFGRSPPAPTALSASAAQVAVIDGDTLRLRETVVRLAGVQAPPRGSACHAVADGPVDCGAQAAAVLGRLVQAQDVSCQLSGRDGMGRPQGRCEAGGQSLNSAVVASGWARSRGDDEQLALAEADARARHAGLWMAGTK